MSQHQPHHHNGHPLKAGYVLSENLEMYLKSIHRIAKHNKVARVKEIASDLKVSKGAVTKALKFLGENGFIDYDPYSYVSLTTKGQKIAEQINQKYQLLTDFFSDYLNVPIEKAKENACRIEHVIDDHLYKALERHLLVLKRLNYNSFRDENWSLNDLVPKQD